MVQRLKTYKKIGGLDKLCCEILIGEADPKDFTKMINPLVINEVLSVEINQTYKKLSATAKVTIPATTLFKKQSQSETEKSKFETERGKDGSIVVKRSNHILASNAHIKTRDRITIKLGYNGNLKTMFDGFVKKINDDARITVECEDLTYWLRLKKAPKIPLMKSVSLVKLCQDKKDGGYGLLEGSGFELHPETIKCNIQLGAVGNIDNFTIADILTSWSHNKIYVFLKEDTTENSNGKPKLAVAMSYINAAQKEDETMENNLYVIDYKAHVASSDIRVTKIDALQLCVDAQGSTPDNKILRMRVRKNPDWDGKNPKDEFLTTNVNQIDRKALKKGAFKPEDFTGAGMVRDWSTYTIVPYVCAKSKNLTAKVLEEEAIEYFRNYNMNGVEGSVTIFGDYGLSSGCRVELVDELHPAKNGIYAVGEVTTTFGVGGYRQKLTLPFRISRSEEQQKKEREE